MNVVGMIRLGHNAAKSFFVTRPTRVSRFARLLVPLVALGSSCSMHQNQEPAAETTAKNSSAELTLACKSKNTKELLRIACDYSIDGKHSTAAGAELLKLILEKGKIPCESNEKNLALIKRLITNGRTAQLKMGAFNALFSLWETNIDTGYLAQAIWFADGIKNSYSEMASIYSKKAVAEAITAAKSCGSPDVLLLLLKSVIDFGDPTDMAIEHYPSGFSDHLPGMVLATRKLEGNLGETIVQGSFLKLLSAEEVLSSEELLAECEVSVEVRLKSCGNDLGKTIELLDILTVCDYPGISYPKVSDEVYLQVANHALKLAKAKSDYSRLNDVGDILRKCGNGFQDLGRWAVIHSMMIAARIDHRFLLDVSGSNSSRELLGSKMPDQVKKTVRNRLLYSRSIELNLAAARIFSCWGEQELSLMGFTKAISLAKRKSDLELARVLYEINRSDNLFPAVVSNVEHETNDLLARCPMPDDSAMAALRNGPDDGSMYH